jgi:hypothetical protein
MTTRGFVSVCLKLVAAFYLVQTMAGFVAASTFQMVSLSSQLGGLYLILVVGLPGLMTLALFWLIRESDSFAGRLVLEDSPLVTPQISLGDLQLVAFSCIGLGFIISALGELAPIVGYHYLISHFRYGGAVLGNSDALYSNLAGILLRLGCGLFLFLHPGGLIALWRWFQDRHGLGKA